jgi:hypothetical protein
MRNDARPIGEEFRDIAEHDPQDAGEGRPKGAPAERTREDHTPFVVNRDPGDEEPPTGASERRQSPIPFRRGGGCASRAFQRAPRPESTGVPIP